MNASRTEKTKDTFWTPPSILDRARLMGPILLDPASDPRNPTKAARWCVHPEWMERACEVPVTPEWFAGILATPGALDGCMADGLAQDWAMLSQGGMVWVNPPFGRAKVQFLVKAHEEAARGAEIQMITPCDPATTWWQRFASPRLAGPQAPAVCFLRQRPAFIDPETGKPPKDAKGNDAGSMFGCQILYWGPRRRAFYETWTRAGDVDLGDYPIPKVTL